MAEETACKPQRVEELEAICLHESDPEKLVYVGTQILELLKNEIVECLKKNADIFAWTLDDMPGIDPDVISHQLNVDPQFRPVR